MATLVMQSERSHTTVWTLPHLVWNHSGATCFEFSSNTSRNQPSFCARLPAATTTTMANTDSAPGILDAEYAHYEYPESRIPGWDHGRDPHAFAFCAVCGGPLGQAPDCCTYVSHRSTGYFCKEADLCQTARRSIRLDW